MSNWEQVKIKDVANTMSGGTPNRSTLEFYEHGDIPWLKTGELKNKFIHHTEEMITELAVQKSSAKLVPENSVIVAMYGATVGNLSINKIPLTTNQACCSILPKEEKLNEEFLYYYLLKDKEKLIKMAAGGAQPNISQQLIKDYEILLPSLKEQQKIAEILSSVDAAIEKTEQVIAKTEEVKKGLMQQLLTKGIGHTEFKQTEMGLIPSSWRIEKLESISHNIFVGIATSTTDYFCNSDQGVPLLRNQNIKENYLDLTDLVYITNDFSEKNRNKKLQKNDVIIVRTGYPGVASVVHDELEGAQTFTTLVVRPCQEYIYSKYLSYYINSEKGKKFVLGGQAGGAQQNLNVAVLQKMPIPIPSISEQLSIVQKLDNIDSVNNKNCKKLDLLNKLKQGLMQQLLTGQVRVKVD